MHSINSLRQTLGLSSANQVRNRIDAAKDLLIAHIRRGPNNQILLTDAGAEVLRRLQELYDSGLTIAEASDVLRANIYQKDTTAASVSRPIMSNDTKPDQTSLAIASLRQQLAYLRQRVAYLEQRLLSEGPTASDPASWWAALREEIDAP